MASRHVDGYPHSSCFHVHWGENDALGHVNNTRYFRWFETARIAAMADMGMTFTADMPRGPILAETGCTFLKPVKAPTQVVVGTRIARVGNTSFRMEHEVELVDRPGEAVARGYVVVVWVDYATGRPVEAPEEVRRAAVVTSSG